MGSVAAYGSSVNTHERQFNPSNEIIGKSNWLG